jgi:capsular exopolysaccharide synthesis family protein
MSRIFDALRRSEMDRNPDDENSAGRATPATQGDAATASPNTALPNNATPQTASPTDAALNAASPVARVPAPAAPAMDEKLAELMRTARAAKGMPDFSQLRPAAAPEPEPEPVAAAVAAKPVAPALDLSKLTRINVTATPSSRLVALTSEKALGAEKFRVLGARLSNIRLSSKLNILQVTSSVVGEGKTLTSVNLAMTLAKRFDQKVLLAEGDLRKPAVCKMLGLAMKPGIGEWWDHPEIPVTDYILRIGDTGMCLLPAGDVAQPASVLQSQRIADLFQELARQFDWVIIDTPPLLPMADSNLWSRISDGTLMVVRKGVVTRSALKKAVESLDNPKMVGVVLNDASDYDRVNYYDQYYTPRGDRPAGA